MRRRFGPVVVAIVATVALEVLVFLGVARLLGLAGTVLLALATSLLGGWLLRREGMRSWRRFRAAAVGGHPPGREVPDGLVGLLGALLLAGPGFVTDLVGAVLLIPPIRGYARGRVERSAERWISPAVAGNLFGPRRVRLRRGRPTRTPAKTPADPVPPEALEGEILRPPNV